MALHPATVAAALTDPVAAVIAARANAEVTRAEVDAIVTELLAAEVYTVADGFREAGERVTQPRNDCTMRDEDSVRYYAARDAAVRAGHPDLAPGFCPALVAEDLLVKAENALIEAAGPMFGITNETLLCGTATKGGLETRREFIDLLCKLTLTAGRLAA